MPKRYEKIRDSLKNQGKSDSEAKRIAAAKENKLRKQEGKSPMKSHKKKS